MAEKIVCWRSQSETVQDASAVLSSGRFNSADAGGAPMRFVTILLQAILGTAVLAGAWWAGTHLLQAGQARAYMLPGPETVAAKVMELAAADAFLQHAWASLTILMYGLTPALLIGIGLGAAAGASSAG